MLQTIRSFDTLHGAIFPYDQFDGVSVWTSADEPCTQPLSFLRRSYERLPRMYPARASRIIPSSPVRKVTSQYSLRHRRSKVFGSIQLHKTALASRPLAFSQSLYHFRRAGSDDISRFVIELLEDGILLPSIDGLDADFFASPRIIVFIFYVAACSTRMAACLVSGSVRDLSELMTCLLLQSC